MSSVPERLAVAEHVYALRVEIIISLDPDALPDQDSDAFREIAAEHIIDFISHSIDGRPAELAAFIDRVELIEKRPVIGAES
jgi:hypothetical protein